VASNNECKHNKDADEDPKMWSWWWSERWIRGWGQPGCWRRRRTKVRREMTTKKNRTMTMIVWPQWSPGASSPSEAVGQTADRMERSKTHAGAMVFFATKCWSNIPLRLGTGTRKSYYRRGWRQRQKLRPRSPHLPIPSQS